MSFAGKELRNMTERGAISLGIGDRRRFQRRNQAAGGVNVESSGRSGDFGCSILQRRIVEIFNKRTR